MTVKPILALLALVSLLVSSAAAHEYWLAPSRYRAEAGDTIAIAAFVGTGFRGERKPFATTRARRFVLRASRELDLARGAVNGDPTWARFVAGDAGGGALVSYESDFASIALDPRAFDDYLAQEGLDRVRAEHRKHGRKRAVRERYARCPKTWIAGTDAARASRPAGLTLELVPLADPSRADRLSVRVLYHGRPLKRALIRAWNRPLGSGAMPTDAATRDSVPMTAAARTDQRGVAVLSVAHPGEWLLSTVHMTRCPDPTVADWQSHWASMTFARLASETR